MAVQYSFGKIVTDGLVLCLDAADRNSYVSGSTTWFNVAGTNNGTLTNGPTFNTGSGGSIVFDGVDDYVSIPNSSVFTVSEVTIAAWFISKKNVDNYITTKGLNSWYVGIGPAGQTSAKLSLFIEGTAGGWLQSNTTINQNQWYYGVCTFKSNTSSIYINGVLDTSATRTGTMSSGTDTVRIGYRSDNLSYFLGNMTSFLLYNRALTASEVLQNYSAQKSRFGL
jgi:hypothetical protein